MYVYIYMFFKQKYFKYLMKNGGATAATATSTSETPTIKEIFQNVEKKVGWVLWPYVKEHLTNDE